MQYFWRQMKKKIVEGIEVYYEEIQARKLQKDAQKLANMEKSQKMAGERARDRNQMGGQEHEKNLENQLQDQESRQFLPKDNSVNGLNPEDQPQPHKQLSKLNQSEPSAQTNPEMQMLRTEQENQDMMQMGKMQYLPN